MEKFSHRILMLLVLCGMSFFIACDDDDPVPPSLELVGGTNFVDSDTTFVVTGDTTIQVRVQTEKGGAQLETFTITVNDSTILETTLQGDSVNGFTAAYLINLPVTAGEVDLAFQVTDRAGLRAFEEITINVEPDINVETSDIELLRPPSEDGTSQTFYSVNLFENFSLTQILAVSDTLAEDIDFGYYINDQNMPIIASPSNFTTSFGYSDSIATWLPAPINTTIFRRTELTEVEFNAITEADGGEIIRIFEMADSEGDPPVVEGFEVGDVIAFRTKFNDPNQDQYGLLRVTNLVVDPQTTVGLVEFVVKKTD
jgi:hypothetical protein